MDDFTIRTDDLTDPRVLALLDYHLAEMVRVSPPDGVNALPLDGLKDPGVTFFTLWQDEDLAGFGALKRVSADHAELKSMRTAPAFLRRGVGEAILCHLIDAARGFGYQRLSLETGRTADYDAARALYRKYGFADCPPFASYRDDGFSQCMTRRI
ncbi:GNAT family N-acetyltransferase [Parasphingopyxis sp. CP4]|uniref:GNAT family N-acetyltransferase n=1 Tax=Parasphingopyxis sp. CP4 TaxID=2724527 RepID=UPI0015A3E128|nr:GNAT family N-acetyltransferase [Parasphingopyxis sp. CP4]QLC22530.1 GNAT family N-acetyltransferase [Parasphingopyxis sp. CP4]